MAIIKINKYLTYFKGVLTMERGDKQYRYSIHPKDYTIYFSTHPFLT